MPLSVARAIVAVLSAYAGLGLAFALVFVWTGIGRLDPMARTGSPGFRLMVLPAVAALWPLLAWRWLCARRAAAPDQQRSGS